MGSAFLVMAFPARAAPLEQIGCIYEVFTPDQIDVLTKQVRDRIHGAPRPDRTKRKDIGWTNTAIETCTKRYGWNEIDSAHAYRYAASLLLMEALRRDSDVKGVNFAMLDDQVVKLRPHGEARPIDDDEKRKLSPVIEQSGVDVSNERAVKHVEVYLVTAFELFEIKTDFMTRKRHQPNVDLGHQMRSGN